MGPPHRKNIRRCHNHNRSKPRVLQSLSFPVGLVVFRPYSLVSFLYRWRLQNNPWLWYPLCFSLSMILILFLDGWTRHFFSLPFIRTSVYDHNYRIRIRMGWPLSSQRRTLLNSRGEWLGHPFDLTKVRLQTAPQGTYTGAIDVVKQTLARDAFLSIRLFSPFFSFGMNNLSCLHRVDGWNWTNWGWMGCRMYRGMGPPLVGVTPIFALSFWVT